MFRTQTVENMGDSIFDTQAVPSSLAEVVPILRVAKEVEPGNVRVAYLCRFYAFEKAHRVDPTSSGRGVRQFKIALLQTLERDNALTLKWRREESDAPEMQQFYLYYYKKFIKPLQNAVHKARRGLLTELYQTEAVLFEVLKAVNVSLTTEVDQAIFKTHHKIEQSREMHAPDYTRPVDPENIGVQHPEVLIYLKSHCKYRHCLEANSWFYDYNFPLCFTISVI